MFPLLSGIACLVVLAGFVIPLWGTPQAQAILKERHVPNDPLSYVLLFLFYFVNYFVIVFFNSALVACAIIRFRGGSPTIGDGLRVAMARVPQIAAWALLSATVGLVLRIIESRSEKVGQFVAGLLGMAWSIVTLSGRARAGGGKGRPDRGRQTLDRPAEKDLGRGAHRARRARA